MHVQVEDVQYVYNNFLQDVEWAVAAALICLLALAPGIHLARQLLRRRKQRKFADAEVRREHKLALLCNAHCSRPFSQQHVGLSAVCLPLTLLGTCITTALTIM